MDEFVDLSRVALETNAPLWQIGESEGEPILQVIGNKEQDHISGKVALVGDLRRNYTMQAEMRFLGHHLPQTVSASFTG